MSSGNSKKPDSFISGDIHFLVEQTGIPENEFKREVVKLFQSQEKNIRAYIAQIEYDKTGDFEDFALNPQFSSM